MNAWPADACLVPATMCCVISAKNTLANKTGNVCREHEPRVMHACNAVTADIKGLYCTNKLVYGIGNQCEEMMAINADVKPDCHCMPNRRMTAAADEHVPVLG